MKDLTQDVRQVRKSDHQNQYQTVFGLRWVSEREILLLGIREHSQG
uniref:Uncharacterized protein n=1 Tax=Pseudomonas syringae pv. actinidiae TaxID=103796 RepID=A0A650D7E5_PSESF|nr:hypothetical protein [Pseudomonas syringae pv. actinidiae]